MTLNIAICDDDNEALMLINKRLLDYSFSRNIDLHIDTYTGGQALIDSYKTGNTPDYHVLMLDIEMPGIDGIRTADIIKHSMSYDTLIVFISNYPEYMLDSFSVHPFHFLQKPVSDTVIRTLMDDIVDHVNHSHCLVTIISGYDTEYTVRTDNIYYIECSDSKSRRLTFHMKDSQLETSGTLTNWKSMLENHSFALCSRNALVNLNHIHYIRGQSIIMENGEVIPISRKNRSLLMNTFLNKVVNIRKK